MKKYEIEIWTPKKGIIKEICNGRNITSAINVCEASHSYVGLVISAKLLFSDNEIFKLSNRLDKPLKLNNDENVLTD